MLNYLILLAVSRIQLSFAQTTRLCRATPEVSTWPSLEKWNQLNTTVKGNLIQTIPPAAVCYQTFNNQTTYNKAECDRVTASWRQQSFHQADPVSVLWSLFTNYTCQPTLDPSQSCTIGNYPVYVINAMTVEDVQAGVKFANENNIRLVVHNTGHDFLGKSIGANSLSIWTHNFKQIEFDDVSGNLKIGSGWHTIDLYEFLSKKGRTLVAGECENVGYAGGFIQGGGRGPLTGLYGMAADHALAFTLVTADGTYITADATQNADLFWALRGGAGSTWGVVISVTVHTVPDMKVASLNITFNEPDQTKFWAGFNTFHDDVEDYMGKGLFLFYTLASNSFTGGPILAPGRTQAELNSTFAPLLARLDKIGVNYTLQTAEYPTFLQMYRGQFTRSTGAGDTGVTGSRIMTKENVIANKTAILDLFRRGSESGIRYVGYMITAGNYGSDQVDNAVNPAWRKALLVPLFLGSTLQGAQLTQAINLVNSHTQKFRDITPGGGSYLNEANVFDPNWREDFWGSNYPRLLSIKKKWDPNGVFYAKTAVGSEEWEELNGQLCKIV